jgi:hypothetical protein
MSVSVSEIEKRSEPRWHSSTGTGTGTGTLALGVNVRGFERGESDEGGGKQQRTMHGTQRTFILYTPR